MSFVIDSTTTRIKTKSYSIAFEQVQTLIKSQLIDPDQYHIAMIDYDPAITKEVTPESDKYYPLVFRSMTGRRFMISGVTAGTNEESSKATLKILKIMGFDLTPSEFQIIGSETKNYFGEINTQIQEMIYKD